MSEFRLRIKLLLKDRVAGICYLAAAVVMLFVLAGLNLVADEQSRVPIGLVCEDDSALAQDLCDRLRANEALRCYELDQETLEHYLRDGYINSILIIPRNYSDKVTAGSNDKLVTIVSVEDDKTSVILGDIIAGCMIREVCINKTYLRYKSLKGSTSTMQELTDWVERIESDPDFSYGFDVVYRQVGDTAPDAGEITNAMLYRQAIACLLAMLMALIVFCSCNGIASEHGNSMTLRRRLLPGNKAVTVLREACALFCYTLPVGIAAAFMLARGSGIKAILMILALNVCFIFVCVLFFYICSQISGGIFAYQLIGTFSVIACGVMGFIYAFGGLMGVDMFGMSPFALYIKNFIELI